MIVLVAVGIVRGVYSMHDARVPSVITFRVGFRILNLVTIVKSAMASA